jgi:hypothetical protein
MDASVVRNDGSIISRSALSGEMRCGPPGVAGGRFASIHLLAAHFRGWLYQDRVPSQQYAAYVSPAAHFHPVPTRPVFEPLPTYPPLELLDIPPASDQWPLVTSKHQQPTDN